MSLFKRLFNIGKAEANAAIDKLEDPIKMTEQGIRDLKKDLNDSLKSLAEIKSISIKTKRELAVYKNQAKDYEQKAILLLNKAEKGGISVDEADRLASEALAKKEKAIRNATTSQQMLDKNDASVAKMEQNVQQLKSQITSWENELKMLKARAKVSSATQKLNKHLSNVDSTGTLSMLERMKEKVEQQEALAESYGEMAELEADVDKEINQALGEGTTSSSLEALKAKLKLNEKKS